MDDLQAYSIEDGWLLVITGEIQLAIGLIEFGEDELGAHSTARGLLSRLPDPRTPVEEQLLRGLLLELAVRWASKAHRRAHGGDVTLCAFRAEARVHDAWARQRGLPDTAKTAFGTWAEHYFRALRRAHPARAEEVACWIVQHSRTRVTERLAARALGVHPVVLRREFQAHFGLSMHAYLERARLADAIRLLTSESHNVRSALYTAGWSSPKSLYRAARKVCGKSLHELRALPVDALGRALALPAAALKSARGNERGSQCGSHLAAVTGTSQT
jgi:AraC-like DNA-binding protein